MKRNKRKRLNLYQKFALVMIILGLLPMLVLSTFIVNRMMEGYHQSMQSNYEQAALHMASSVENMLHSYNSASQIAYQYNFGKEVGQFGEAYTYDNLRRILSGELYGKEGTQELLEADMRQFLKTVESTDTYIHAVHFLADSEETGEQAYHFSLRNTFFKEEELFRERVGWENWDRTSRELTLIPTHEADYFNGMSRQVFTVARNYFDLRGNIGQELYIGTLFLDVDVEKLKVIFKKIHLDGTHDFYLVNAQNDCFYARDTSCIGCNLETAGRMPVSDEETLVITTEPNDYGLKIVMAVDTKDAFRQLNSLQLTMYVFVFGCAAALMLASFYFSRKLTRPIHRMMEQMSRVESGQFDLELPVESEDEIGILSERFNRMSRELKNYINQSYVLQIKQNEAELTALRSQIYPHFLYNTLEIIRMSALEKEDFTVSQMIEALSEQIHYLIGPVQDLVPLEKELDIVRKYVYLLNCRIQGKVLLAVNAPGSSGILVPRLILQPIVENAYVHGIKPKNGKGSIRIEAVRRGEKLELSVMDNGVGMEEETLARIRQLLEGDTPGIRNEYNWQSIGLKNVNDRIRYLYGEEYGLQITSSAGMGTIMQIWLPWQEASEEKERKEWESNADNDIGG